MDTIVGTQEQIDRINAAEHRFCEAIDLKVDPNTYDGGNCERCILGQIAFADHLINKQPEGHYVDSNGDYIYPSQIPELIASAYGIDLEKAVRIFNEVDAYCNCDYDYYSGGEHEEWCSTWVAIDLEAAKREVVAAYMDCYNDN